MDEDTIFVICLIVGSLLLTGIICFTVAYSTSKNIELEKYKIEMQVKHGDIDNTL